jgi:hypothetical protein
MKIMETNGLEMLVASSDVSLSEYPDELNWLGKGVDTIDQGFSLKLMTRFNPSHPNALIQMLAAHLGPLFVHSVFFRFLPHISFILLNFCAARLASPSRESPSSSLA